MIRGLQKAAKSLGIEPETKKGKNNTPNSRKSDRISEDVPMMYRAQVSGRCSLMFAGKNDDLNQWKDEWISPNPKEPRYQKKELPLGLDGTIYRIAVDFPFRLINNCGQDSIIRPTLDNEGIPHIPGSSVKGLFRRACISSSQVNKYCGNDSSLSPSKIGFRFHGAYPVGDWAGTNEVVLKRRGETIRETRYRVLDVIHPQQKRQVGDPSQKRNATALASVSLYRPTMIFEFSCSDKKIDWQEVEDIFWRAIAMGIGGKTSTGYGLGGHNETHAIPAPSSQFSIALTGRGVSSTLRSDEPEFRPNLFKATLRGHYQRLLAGVVNERRVLDREVERLFGSSSSPGKIQLFWRPSDSEKPVKYTEYGRTQTFQAEGVLHIDAPTAGDVELTAQVLKFAFIMGGFGKSWRRASHELFYQTYRKFEIGCHWELIDPNSPWIEIKSPSDLTNFLKKIHQDYKHQFSKDTARPQDWRESWHPDRLSVYGAIVSSSQAIRLFHDEVYKTTPAIGGKNPGDKRPKYMSSVWHRMLPVGPSSYLEIVTVFHGQRRDWQHAVEGDQLHAFLNSLKEKNIDLIWGNENPSIDVASSSKSKKKIPDPKR